MSLTSRSRDFFSLMRLIDPGKATNGTRMRREDPELQHEPIGTWSGANAVLLLKLQTTLERLSRNMVWQIVILGTIAITIATCTIYPSGLMLQPLYLLPICIASWRLGFPVGLGLAIVSAMLPASIIGFPKDGTVGTQIPNLMALMFVQGVVAAIVSSLRHSYSQERYRARHDLMTGALTRQAFDQDLQTLIAAGTANDRQLLLLYLDLDGFKGVNDQYGHHVGDELLQAFSAGILLTLRREDFLGRVGGDEFALAIPLSPGEDVQQIAQLQHRRFSSLLSMSGHAVTCSVGALIVPPGFYPSCAELMQSADQLMYASKKSGKNAITIATAATFERAVGRNKPQIHAFNLPDGTRQIVANQIGMVQD